MKKKLFLIVIISTVLIGHGIAQSEYGGEDDSGGGFTGGGGGSTGGDDETSSTDINIKWNKTSVHAGYGNNVTGSFEIVNLDDEDNGVQISFPDTGKCERFSVQKQKGIGIANIGEYSSSGSFNVPAPVSGENYGSLSVGFRVDMPSEAKVSGGNISCSPTVEVQNGDASMLVLTAEEKQGFFEWLLNLVLGFFEWLKSIMPF